MSPGQLEEFRLRRAALHKMRCEGHTNAECAAAFGMSEDAVRTAVSKATHGDGLGPVPRPPSGALAEDPEAIGNVLAKLIVADATDQTRNASDKFKALHAAAADCGLRPSVVKALIKRLSMSLAPVREEGKRLTVAEVTAEIEKKISMVLEYIDPYTVAQANLKDLSFAMSVLVEKHQLLSGKPTMIVDLNTRLKLPALVGSMLAEARRRGVTIEGTAQVVSDGPG